MTDRRPLDETELDGLFAVARSHAPEPSRALLARVMADAEAEIAAAAGVPATARGGSRFAAWLRGFGLWPAAGLATATLAGLMIGLVTPDTLDELTGGYLAATSYELNDLMPSYGDILGEG
ncbi:MAG: dihydroorotate dehydrogenase [Rhodobacter sp.]|nr:dihydroorotate dehydrogenase [Rhodobacter sp.]